jgi:hypothetical protein
VTVPPVMDRSTALRVLGICKQRTRCSQPMGVFLNAGRRPKRATKVTKERSSTPAMSLRRTFMVRGRRKRKRKRKMKLSRPQ